MEKNSKKNKHKDFETSKLNMSFSPGFAKEREYFIENLAILLSSGLDILSIIQAMRSEFSSKKMKSIVAYLEERIEDGATLWQSLQPLNLVPDYVISLIKIGEETGKLPENFKVIVSQRKKDKELKSKIQSAMTYPLIVFALSVIILLGITWFVLPSLSSVYGRLGIELPAITRVLIALGDFMAKYGAIVVPAILIIFGSIIYFIFFFRKTKHLGQILLFKSPGVAKYVREIELSRMGFYLGTLLGSGVPLNDSLTSLINVGSFYPYLKLYKFIYEKTLEGFTFENCFAAFPKINKYIPLVTQNMIINGEKSGHLASVFETIGEIYEQKSDNATKNLASILEPAMLIVVWIGVAGIALGIVLPIYSLIGNIGDVASPQTNNTPAPEATATPTAIITVTPTQTSTPIPTPTPITKLEVLKTSVGYVNVRATPSLSGKVVKKANQGEQYQYISSQSGWYQIIIDENTNGWISSQYIKLVQ